MVAPLTRATAGEAALVAVPKVIGGAALVALNLWVARHLEPAPYGVFAVASTCLLLLDGIVGAALDAGVIRSATGAPIGEDAGLLPPEAAGIAVKIAAGLAFALVALPAAAAIGRADLVPIVALVLAGGVGLLVLRSLLVYLQVRESFATYGAVDLTHTVLRCGVVALVLASGRATPERVIGGYAIASWIVVLLAASMVPAAFHVSGATLRALLRTTGPALATTAVGAIVARLDILLLGAAGTTSEAGVFGAASTLALIPTWLGAYLAPAFSARIVPYCRSGRMQPFLAGMQRRLGIAAGLALAAGLAFAPLAIRALLPPAYERAAFIVPVLLVGGLAGFVTFPLVLHTLLFLSPRTYLVMDLVSIPILVPLYLTVAPRWGALGVAWITSVSAVTKAAIAQAAAAAAVRRAEAAPVFEAVV